MCWSVPCNCSYKVFQAYKCNISPKHETRFIEFNLIKKFHLTSSSVNDNHFIKVKDRENTLIYVMNIPKRTIKYVTLIKNYGRIKYSSNNLKHIIISDNNHKLWYYNLINSNIKYIDTDDYLNRYVVSDAGDYYWGKNEFLYKNNKEDYINTNNTTTLKNIVINENDQKIYFEKESVFICVNMKDFTTIFVQHITRYMTTYIQEYIIQLNHEENTISIYNHDLKLLHTINYTDIEFNTIRRPLIAVINNKIVLVNNFKNSEYHVVDVYDLTMLFRYYRRILVKNRFINSEEYIFNIDFLESWSNGVILRYAGCAGSYYLHEIFYDDKFNLFITCSSGSIKKFKEDYLFDRHLIAEIFSFIK
jgi:hypothetical protein